MDSIVTLDGVDIISKDLTEEFSDLFRLTFDLAPVFLVLDNLFILNFDELLHINGGLLEIGIALQELNKYSVVFFLINDEFRLFAVDDGPLFHFLTFNQFFVFFIRRGVKFEFLFKVHEILAEEWVILVEDFSFLLLSLQLAF